MRLLCIRRKAMGVGPEWVLMAKVLPSMEGTKTGARRFTLRLRMLQLTSVRMGASRKRRRMRRASRPPGAPPLGRTMPAAKMITVAVGKRGWDSWESRRKRLGGHVTIAFGGHRCGD